jgi:triacylglycerol esterase/lipase EstA (alpha/beta hydrolase family)
MKTIFLKKIGNIFGIAFILQFMSLALLGQKRPTAIQPVIQPGITKINVAPFLDKNRPVCIVLIHGITNTIATSQQLTPHRPVNTLKFARHYWSYEFNQGLLGLVSDKLYTFSNGAPAGELSAAPDVWEQKLTNSSSATDHILTGSGIPGETGPGGTKGFLTVMMTHRDGSLSLKKQTAAAAAQIKQLYDQVYGSWPATKQPQLILLSHSGGGLVARAICTKPTGLGGGISSLGNSSIPVETFTEAELNNMEFIRNRTLYIVTLATPHEGAPIAKVADQIGQHLASLKFLDKTIIISQDIYDQNPNTPIMKELTPNIMDQYNKGPLHPAKCKRTDGSLIPIYCLGGRAAAGPYFFNDPNKYDLDLKTPDGGIKFIKDQLKFETKINGVSNRRAFESYGLLKADYLTTLLYGIVSLKLDGLGAVTGFDKRFFVATSDNPLLDIVKIRNNGLLGCLDPPVYNFADFAAGPKFFYLRDDWTNNLTVFNLCAGTYKNNGSSTTGDGLIDCDGFVPIISSLGVNLGTTAKNYFDHTQNGSWYRFYRSAADYDNHGSIMQRFEVGEFIRKNITNINYATNLLGGGIVDPAAGPYVKASGNRSSWTK